MGRWIIALTVTDEEGELWDTICSPVYEEIPDQNTVREFVENTLDEHVEIVKHNYSVSLKYHAVH